MSCARVYLLNTRVYMWLTKCYFVFTPFRLFSFRSRVLLILINTLCGFEHSPWICSCYVLLIIKKCVAFFVINFQESSFSFVLVLAGSHHRECSKYRNLFWTSYFISRKKWTFDSGVNTKWSESSETKKLKS